ncbi:glycogen debranching protein GlgX [Spirochaeta isovalerica]|uniref:Glycogen operon protein n=1 Tax=Spirochaeta isovalerica TaxID=150 RepID=A0A841R659_9SPIO|nr:glycogen debranching protein GlgX [Spirochaeta isovalerica]MBB6479323.1 glycogen operon protein [Spirochaeta isovalerica]
MSVRTTGTNYTVYPGEPLPFGATVQGNGVNFAVLSRHATSVTLLLFDKADNYVPMAELVLDPYLNKTGDVWHIRLEGMGEGTHYLYRVDGPYVPEKGHRFNRFKVLLDPYCKAISTHESIDLDKARGYDWESDDRDLSFSEYDDIMHMPKSLVVCDDFDWQGDRPLNFPLRHSIIYETHVSGLTKHPSSGVAHPGTYKGVVEMIPYFKELGITSLELLPIMEYDHMSFTRVNPITDEHLENYWGYDPIAFFAPNSRYASDSKGAQVTEFKEMVRELHKEGIEVILDVVFNHTGEGSELGPTISFRGWDNEIYYILADEKRYYMNYSGCGNTMNCNHPIVRTMIRNCLHYWVIEMHVDGFRFDLGSILGRDRYGNLMENPPILEGIAEDPVLRNTKIIAEAWDAGGAYQVGSFPGGRWAEWNDRFRDDVRGFWRGDKGKTRVLATRLTGSSDLYLRDGRKPFHSINFVTSHDGFTLWDLVSYNRKHNEANGEENRDGSDNNISYNHGEEGETRDPKILELRKRQARNFLTTLMLSLGTPMILGGDELLRTQEGNNNAYCQNNEVSWFDWNRKKENGDNFTFLKRLIKFRKRHPAFHRPEFFLGIDTTFNAIPDITWYNYDGDPPVWEDMDHCLAYRLDGTEAEVDADKDDNDFYLMFNGSDRDRQFTIKTLPPPGTKWFRAIDTAVPGEKSITLFGDEEVLRNQKSYKVTAKSVVVLISRVV